MGARNTTNGSENSLLIADDSTTSLLVHSQILSPHYRVQSTHSGLQAVEIAMRDRPHAVVLDLMMPDLDGAEVCRRIKAVAELENTPVLFVTARTDEEAIASCKAAGAVAVLTKPVGQDELLAAVAAAIASANPD